MNEQLNQHVHDLRLSLDSFTLKFNNEAIKLEKASNTFNQDFSVLLNQDFFDSLSIFPSSQFEITNKLYSLILFLKNSNNDETINILNDFYLKILDFNFKNDLIEYINNANIFITFCKTSSGKIFDKQLKAAQPIINIWHSFIININAYTKIIDELKHYIFERFFLV